MGIVSFHNSTYLTIIPLQLWEESQSENRRLRLENNALKLELQTTKTQLELAVQVITIGKKVSLIRPEFPGLGSEFRVR